jgi:hypothetical protein
MSQASIASQPAPSTYSLVAGSIAATMFSFLAWLLISLEVAFNPHVSHKWIYVGLLLPAVTAGSIGTHAKGRWIYFWIGLAITLIPLVAYFVLQATVPPPPPMD